MNTDPIDSIVSLSFSRKQTPKHFNKGTGSNYQPKASLSMIHCCDSWKLS